jgi:hypothetical protein
VGVDWVVEEQPLNETTAITERIANIARIAAFDLFTPRLKEKKGTKMTVAKAMPSRGNIEPCLAGCASVKASPDE